MLDRLSDGDFSFQVGAGWSACTARGAARAENKDAFAVRINGASRAFAVADGVSSLPRSAMASQAAARAAVSEAAGSLADAVELGRTLNLAVRSVLRGQERAGATTIAAARADSSGVWVATVGDSEVLAIGCSGPAERLTDRDRSPEDEHLLFAWIDGVAEFVPHIIRLSEPPVRLCLVTDGITKVLDYEAIASVGREAPITAAAHALVKAAQAAGARDDVTVVLFEPRGGDRGDERA